LDKGILDNHKKICQDGWSPGRDYIKGPPENDEVLTTTLGIGWLAEAQSIAKRFPTG
jgi:hypothetical protein